MQDLINQALNHRAELVESRIDLNSRNLSSKAVRNALLPTLDAFAYYGGSGVGGNINPAGSGMFSHFEQVLLYTEHCSTAIPNRGGGWLWEHAEPDWLTRPHQTKA